MPSCGTQDERPGDMIRHENAPWAQKQLQWSRPMNGRATYGQAIGWGWMNPLQWSRPMNGRATPGAFDGPLGVGATAMEPADERPGDGSCNSSRLSCANARFCEQSPLKGCIGVLFEVFKILKQPVTCVRALPWVGLTTPALAHRPCAPRSPPHDRTGRARFGSSPTSCRKGAGR